MKKFQLLGLGTLALTTTLIATQVGAQSNLPPVEITYTYPGAVPRDTDLVAAALTAMVKPKINATIKLDPVDWGAYDQKRNLAFAAGQRCDIVFTAPWINNYGRNVVQGNLLPIDDLLKKQAPKLWASLSPAAWEAARVNGKIYGVINQQAFPKTWGFIALEKYAKQYNLNVSIIRRYADLEPYLLAFKKDNPNSYPVFLDNSGNNGLFQPEQLGWDTLVDWLVSVRYNDRNLKVFNPLQQPQFLLAVQLARRWNQLGLLAPQLGSQSDVDALKKAGRGMVEFNQWRPDSQTQWRARYGGEIVGKSLSPSVLTTGAMTATMNSICKSSPVAERAMMFLELLNTDPLVYNTLAKGIEGRHWVFKDKSKGIIGLPEGVTAQTSTYNPGTDWMFGNLFNAFPNNEDAIAEIKLSASANRAARASVALGFTLDQEPIKTELAQLNAVFKEYGLPLVWGQIDPAKGVPNLVSRLKTAGSDRVLAEVQRQINAWAKR
jgi:putative aldouronate transport system substrate-binding protein